MLLYIVRHGDPDYTTDSLTDRGILQANAVAKRLAASGIDRVFTSPMGRARQTAEPTCKLLGIDYEVEEWTHEIGDEKMTPYPDGVMKSISHIPNTVFRQDGNIYLPYERACECTAIDQTNMPDALRFLEENGNEFLERLGYKAEGGLFRTVRPNDDRVALFCHTAFARAWLSILLHIPLHIVWASFQVTHTSVTVLEFKNYESGFTAPKCLCLSDMSHLFSEGLDMIYDNKVKL